MTGSDGDSDSEADSGDAESSASPSTDHSGSRFGEFFGRLDERGGDSDRSVASDSESAAADRDTELNEWVWGSPQRKPDGEGTDAAGTAPPPSDRKPETDPSDLSDRSETADDRIWNAEPDERLSPSDTDPARSDSGSDVSDDETDTVPTERDEPAPTDGTNTSKGETDKGSELTDSNRWAEIGSGLRTDEGTEPTADDQPSGTDIPADITGSEPVSRDRSGADDDELSWPTSEPSSEPDVHSEGSVDTTTLDESRTADLDRVTSTASVLVLGPTGAPVSDAICSRFLMDDERSRDVIFVTSDDAPSDRIDVCHRADGWADGEIGVIEIGRGGRNDPVASEITGAGVAGSITVRCVSKPGDLSKLGIMITQLLSKFDGNSRQTVLCFHTLSALHNQVGTKTLFRFLNTLQGRLRTSNAVGHYHMDPDLHDEIVIETLRPIFDSVVRFSADGDLEIE